jgi:hypothetical protein
MWYQPHFLEEQQELQTDCSLTGTVQSIFGWTKHALTATTTASFNLQRIIYNTF